MDSTSGEKYLFAKSNPEIQPPKNIHEVQQTFGPQEYYFLNKNCSTMLFKCCAKF
jgi:hypothetical protein